jgi:hypothetical protein
MSVHLPNVNTHDGMTAIKTGGERMCIGVGQVNELTVDPMDS